MLQSQSRRASSSLPTPPTRGYTHAGARLGGMARWPGRVGYDERTAFPARDRKRRM